MEEEARYSKVNKNDLEGNENGKKIKTKGQSGKMVTFQESDHKDFNPYVEKSVKKKILLIWSFCGMCRLR